MTGLCLRESGGEDSEAAPDLGYGVGWELSSNMVRAEVGGFFLKLFPRKAYDFF
jgi:hypothetical protein